MLTDTKRIRPSIISKSWCKKDLLTHWSYVFLALTRRYKQNLPHVYTSCTSPVPEIHIINICHFFSAWTQCPQIWPIALVTVFVSIASLVTHKRHHFRLTRSFTFKSGTVCLSVCLERDTGRSFWLIVTELGPHMECYSRQNPVVLLGQRSNN